MVEAPGEELFRKTARELRETAPVLFLGEAEEFRVIQNMADGLLFYVPRAAQAAVAAEPPVYGIRHPLKGARGRRLQHFYGLLHGSVVNKEVEVNECGKSGLNVVLRLEVLDFQHGRRGRVFSSVGVAEIRVQADFLHQFRRKQGRVEAFKALPDVRFPAEDIKAGEQFAYGAGIHIFGPVTRKGGADIVVVDCEEIAEIFFGSELFKKVERLEDAGM